MVEGQYQEAERILKALERILPQVPDKEGWVKSNFERCCALLNRHEQSSHQEKLSEHLQMGIWGEELAASYLRQKGFVILGRDWHSVHRDIDIIAQDGDTIVFVEVKTRRNRDFGDPVQAVDAEKRYHLRKAINHYPFSMSVTPHDSWGATISACSVWVNQHSYKMLSP